jgi:hypothetical protein
MRTKMLAMSALATPSPTPPPCLRSQDQPPRRRRFWGGRRRLLLGRTAAAVEEDGGSGCSSRIWWQLLLAPVGFVFPGREVRGSRAGGPTCKMRSDSRSLNGWSVIHLCTGTRLCTITAPVKQTGQWPVSLEDVPFFIAMYFCANIQSFSRHIITSALQKKDACFFGGPRSNNRIIAI